MKRNCRCLAFGLLVIIALARYDLLYSQQWLALFRSGEYGKAIEAIRNWVQERPDSSEIGRFFIAQSAYELGLKELNSRNWRRAAIWFNETLQNVEGLSSSRFLRDGYPGYDIEAYWRFLWSVYRLGQVSSTAERCLRLWQRLAPLPSSLWERSNDRWKARLSVFEAVVAAQRLSLSLGKAVSQMKSPPDLFTSDLQFLLDAIRRLEKISSGEYEKERKIALLVCYGVLADMLWRVAEWPKASLEQVAGTLGAGTRDEILSRCLKKLRRMHAELPLSIRKEWDAEPWLELFDPRGTEAKKPHLIGSLSLAAKGRFADAIQLLGNRQTAESRGWAVVFNQVLGTAAELPPFPLQTFPDADFRSWSLKILFSVNHAWMNLMLALQEERFSILRDELAQLDRLENYRNHRLAGDLRFLRTLIRIFLNENPQQVIRDEYGEGLPAGDVLNILRFVFSEIAKMVGYVRGSTLESLLNGPVSQLLSLPELQASSPAAVAFYGFAKEYLLGMLKFRRARVNHFENLAGNITASPQSPFFWELRYLKGRALLEAERYEDAEKEFEEIYNQTRSLRALYYLGISHLLMWKKNNIVQNAANAVSCFEAIVTRFRQRGSWQVQYFVRNAEAARNELPSDISTEPSVAIGDIVYPDMLVSANAPGGIVRFEELGDQEFIRESFREKAKQWIRWYAPHFPVVQITELRRFEWTLNQTPGIVLDVGEHFLLGKPTLYVYLPGVHTPDQVRLRANIDNPSRVYFSLTDTAWVVPDITVSKLSLSLLSDVFVPFFETFPVNWVGSARLTVPVVPRYEVKRKERISLKDVSIPGWEILAVPDRSKPLKAIFVKKAWMRWLGGSVLENDFRSDQYLRDIVYHPDLRGFMVTDARENCVWFYPVSGDSLANRQVWQIHFGEGDPGLWGPEGITVGPDGLVYIADFNNHRILVVDPYSKEVVKMLGTFALCDSNNEKDTVGGPIGLSIPSELYVQNTGQVVRFRHWDRQQTFFWIADDCGLRVCDDRGLFLYTVYERKPDDPLFLSFILEWQPSRPVLYVLDKDRAGVWRIQLQAKTLE